MRFSWWPRRGQTPTFVMIDRWIRVVFVFALLPFMWGIMVFARRGPATLLPVTFTLLGVLLAAAAVVAWVQLRRQGAPEWGRLALVALGTVVVVIVAVGADPTTTGRTRGLLNGPEGAAVQAAGMLGPFIALVVSLAWGWRRLLALSMGFTALATIVCAWQGLRPKMLVGLALVIFIGSWLTILVGWLLRRLLELVRRIFDGRETWSALAVTRERMRFSQDLDNLSRSDLGAITAAARRAEQMLAAPSQAAGDAAIDALLTIRMLVDEAGDRMRRLAAGYRDDAAQPAASRSAAVPSRPPPGSMRARVAEARRAAEDMPRLERFVRWYFYASLVSFAVTPVMRVFVDPRAYSTPIAAGELALIGIAALQIRRSLLLRPVPAGVRPAFAALSLGLALASLVSYGPDLADKVSRNPVPSSVLLGSIPLTVTVLSLHWRWSRVVALGWAMAGLVLSVAWLLDAAPHLQMIGMSVGTLINIMLSCAQGPAAWWLLDGAWSLHGEREAKAQLAVTQERLRFARELHDGRGRVLAAVAVKSQLAVEYIRRRDPRAGEEVASVIALIDQMNATQPATEASPELDFFDELRTAQALVRSLGMQMVVHGAGHVRHQLPENAHQALAAVLREAVTNIVRHSHAHLITVELIPATEADPADGSSEPQTMTTLRISNDGVNPTEKPSTGRNTGLLGLRERITALGGELDAGLDRDRFVVTARVPATSAAVG